MELRQLKMNMCNMVWNNGFSRLSYQAYTKARAERRYNWKSIWEWGENYIVSQLNCDVTLEEQREAV